MPSPPNPIDVHVGKRLRMRRVMLGMSQEALGKASSVTFQQIQKYERGINRLSASRMYEFGKVLGVPVAFFFEGLNEPTVAPQSRILMAIMGQSQGMTDKQQRLVLALVEAITGDAT